MKIPQPVQRTRFALTSVALVSAALWSAAIGAVVFAGAELFASGLSFLSWLAAVATMLAILWRWRWVRSAYRVALWLEERAPTLQYALVTMLEPRFAPLSNDLARRVAAVDLRTPAWRVIAPNLVAATVAAVIGLAALMLSTSDAVASRAAAVLGGGGPIPGLSDALSNLTVTVQPPQYTGQRVRELRDPETIRALIGSAITVGARAPAAGVSARIGEEPLIVRGNPWRTAFVMPALPRALRLADSITGTERVIVVEPVPDELPRVVLSAPRRDTLLRAAPTSVPVAAEVSDDVGLAEAAIEYMISSGQEETFTARTGRVDARAPAGARSTRLGGVLGGSVLRLGPGDVLSIRAVARDRNTVSGPGVGVSETRTIRIARSDEGDSLAVEAIAPVFGDSALLSQRMILLRTEALVRALPGLTRDSLVSAATAIAFDQERLRNRVHSLVFPGHEHADESPLAGEPPDHAEPPDPVNADLKEAYEAMWEAGRELRVGSPQTAVPPMRIAVAALDRARLASRVYLRGGIARVVPDLESVRLTGTERGTSTGRSARAPADTTLRLLIGRLARVSADTTGSRIARMNALSELRVELLSVSLRAAAAVASATTALREGRDPRVHLRTAASELTGEATVRDTVLPWSSW